MSFARVPVGRSVSSSTRWPGGLGRYLSSLGAIVVLRENFSLMAAGALLVATGIVTIYAGRVFLDHARVMLSQAETAVQSVRQIANPAKPFFALGFMIGHDST